MPDEEAPQFFTPDTKGDSQAMYKTLINNVEALKTSEIASRNRQYLVKPSSNLAIDGIPGIPFERSAPNPDVFFQGEDIVYDVFLYHDGAIVLPEDYDIQVIVKASPRAATVVWSGTLDNGVYPNPGGTGYYEIWIPSAATEALLAGTYYLNIQIQEKVGSGKGRFDRRYVLLQTSFNIDYSNFSGSPESITSSRRANVERTWPNGPNTVGNKSQTTDEQVFYSSD